MKTIDDLKKEIDLRIEALNEILETSCAPKIPTFGDLDKYAFFSYGNSTMILNKGDRVITPEGNGIIEENDRYRTICVKLDKEPDVWYEFKPHEIRKE